jgi:cytochrome P450
VAFRLKQGDPIVIPIYAINRSQQLWGADAAEWKLVTDPSIRESRLLSDISCHRPERWLGEGPANAVHAIPGVWGNMLTFLGGVHACIGYRFSLYEYVNRRHHPAPELIYG